MYASGACDAFSTNKKPTDTHVCLAVEISVMGEFKPSDEPISLDRPKKEDFERMLRQRNEQLERQLRIEREKKRN